MSNRLLTAVWKVRVLPCNAKCVLANLADRADNDGNCFPSQELICADCGVKARTLRDILLSLEVKGHITIKREVRRTVKGGSAFSYNVHPATPAAVAGVTPANRASDTSKGAAPDRQMPAPTPANGVGSILTSRNPINPKGNHAPPPLPSQLPELIDRIKKEIHKMPESETEKVNALRLRLGEYEAQLFGAAVTERPPARIQARTAPALKRFIPSPELSAAFHKQAQAVIEQTTPE